VRFKRVKGAQVTIKFNAFLFILINYGSAVWRLPRRYRSGPARSARRCLGHARARTCPNRRLDLGRARGEECRRAWFDRRSTSPRSSRIPPDIRASSFRPEQSRSSRSHQLATSSRSSQHYRRSTVSHRHPRTDGNACRRGRITRTRGCRRWDAPLPCQGDQPQRPTRTTTSEVGTSARVADGDRRDLAPCRGAPLSQRYR
jgi:hypothetical protein